VLLLDHGPGGPAASGASGASGDDRVLAGAVDAVAGSPSTVWPDVDFFPEYFPE
jgi:hypothetical protein